MQSDGEARGKLPLEGCFDLPQRENEREERGIAGFGYN